MYIVSTLSDKKTLQKLGQGPGVRQKTLGY